MSIVVIKKKINMSHNTDTDTTEALPSATFVGYRADNEGVISSSAIAITFAEAYYGRMKAVNVGFATAYPIVDGIAHTDNQCISEHCNLCFPIGTGFSQYCSAFCRCQDWEDGIYDPSDSSLIPLYGRCICTECNGRYRQDDRLSHIFYSQRCSQRSQQ